MESTQDVIQRLAEQIRTKSPDTLRAAAGTYQFHLTGDDGGDWALIIQDGAADVVAGTEPAAGVTVTMSAADFKDLAAQRLNAMSAFMAGRLKVAGDMGLAMKLAGLL
jgi:putative sterol carrier protein